VDALRAITTNWVADEFSLAGNTPVRIILPGDQEVDLLIRDLYGICRGDLSDLPEIRQAFLNGELRTTSATPLGQVRRCVIGDIVRHDSRKKALLVVRLSGDRMATFTEDHSLFLWVNPWIVPVKTSDLRFGMPVAIIEDGILFAARVEEILQTSTQEFTYDLCVPECENFVLSNGILAHNTYSIGGISLDLDKSSKYQGLMDSMNQSFESMIVEAKKVEKYTKGLRQSRFNPGFRSGRVGPHVSRGVMSPRNYIMWG